MSQQGGNGTPVLWCDTPIIDPASQGGADIREMPCGECEACLAGMLYNAETGRIYVPRERNS